MSKRIMLPLEYNLLTCPCLSMCSTHYSPSNSLLCTSCIYDIVLTLTPGQMLTSQKPYQSVSNIGTHNRNTYNQPHLWSSNPSFLSSGLVFKGFTGLFVIIVFLKTRWSFITWALVPAIVSSVCTQWTCHGASDLHKDMDSPTGVPTH